MGVYFSSQRVAAAFPDLEVNFSSLSATLTNLGSAKSTSETTKAEEDAANRVETDNLAAQWQRYLPLLDEHIAAIEDDDERLAAIRSRNELVDDFNSGDLGDLFVEEGGGDAVAFLSGTIGADFEGLPVSVEEIESLALDAGIDEAQGALTFDNLWAADTQTLTDKVALLRAQGQDEAADALEKSLIERNAKYGEYRDEWLKSGGGDPEAFVDAVHTNLGLTSYDRRFDKTRIDTAVSRESSALPQASAYLQQLQGIIDDPNADPKQQMEAERLISSLTEGGGAVALAQKYAVSDNGRFEDFVTGEVQALGSGQISYDNPFLPGGRLNPNIDPNEVSRFAGSPHQVDNEGQLLGSLEDPNTGELTDRANLANLTNRRDLANSGYGFEQGLMQLAAQYGFDPNDQQVYDIIRQTTGETRAFAAPTGTFAGQEGRGTEHPPRAAREAPQPSASRL